MFEINVQHLFHLFCLKLNLICNVAFHERKRFALNISEDV